MADIDRAALAVEAMKMNKIGRVLESGETKVGNAAEAPGTKSNRALKEMGVQIKRRSPDQNDA